MASYPPRPGDSVRLVTTKWEDRPHWEHDAVHLGTDRHGDWVGLRKGTRMSRPGLSLDAACDLVVLAPVAAAGAWLATFHREVTDVHTYVDITTPPTWVEGADGRPAVTAVDLDLDVIRAETGDVWVDDEDEFADHQVSLGYPADVVRLAEESCPAVLEAVLQERAPYDGVTARGWFAELDRLAPG